MGKRPLIQVLFEIPSDRLSKIVYFMIDSGSLFSALSEKEATLMGLDCSALPFSKGEAIGFGGHFKTKMINKLVVLTFRDNGNESKIRYSSGFKVVCIPSDLPEEEREEMLRQTPSVLGMDILTKFSVYMDKRKVELTCKGK